MINPTDARLADISRKATAIFVRVCTDDISGPEMHKYLVDAGFDPKEGKARVELIDQMHLLTEVNRLREAVPLSYPLLEFHARRKFKKPTVAVIAEALGETVGTISQYRRKGEAQREWICRIAALEDLPPKPPRKRSPRQKRSD
jgi:hypothetical protein